MSKAPQIKNRAPAPIQITAEQILREAQERGIEEVAKAPKQFVTDQEELMLYRQTKRKDFEDQLRRQRQHTGLWCRYALWEASQLEFARARSVFERALEVDYRNQTLWLKYAEMEMKNKFINHARNVWDRAVSLLPRVDSFWYKYTYMEEMVGAVENARQIFERWMHWEPDDLAWAAFIKFEMRQGDVDKARSLYERYVALWPTCRAYLKYARWEEGLPQNRENARKVYERALQELHVQEKSEKLLLNFARFEERCKEYERARVIYQYAIQQCSMNKISLDIQELKNEFVLFEKRHGNKENIEQVIVQQKRESYESELIKDSYNYDIWFDYIHLEENEGSIERTREIYERAIQYIPLVKEKKYWKRYIYLWIYYAIFEELTVKDIDATRKIYQRCLDILPHKLFTFGKIWLMFAHFEVRQKNLLKARQILGQGIGQCEKENIFKGYIELELQLGEVERCRKIYNKYISVMPFNCHAWKSFAQLEYSVGEISRARSIYNLAVQQTELDMPELIWKAYIDMEISLEEYTNVRQLYEQLIDRSHHVKVWISYGQFEYDQVFQGVVGNMDKIRDVFTRGYDEMKQMVLKEERLVLLEAWRDVESQSLKNELVGSSRDALSQVENKFPKKIKMKRTNEETGEDEEYYDYVYPDDEKKFVGMKLLEKAMAWKNAMKSMGGGFDNFTAAASSLEPNSYDQQQPENNESQDDDNNNDESGNDSILGKRKSEVVEDSNELF